jgi:hypothetical protein
MLLKALHLFSLDALNLRPQCPQRSKPTRRAPPLRTAPATIAPFMFALPAMISLLRSYSSQEI